MVQNNVAIPVLAVDLVDPTDQQLELIRVEHRDLLKRQHLVEAGSEFVHLMSDAVAKLVLEHQVDILLLVVVGDVNVLTARFELDLCRGAVGHLLGERKRGAEDLAAAVRVEDVLEIAVVVGVEGLNIVQRDRQLQHRLVERPDKVRVQPGGV